MITNNINIRNLIFDENAFKDWTTSKSPIYYFDDLMGKITCGAVCCELYLSNNSNKDYCIGQNALNAYILLLGKDGGLKKDNIPYSQEGSFFCRSFDTYKETMEGIIEDFCKFIQDNPELEAATERTDLTWDEIYDKSFSGLTNCISWNNYSETLNREDEEDRDI